MAKLAEEEISLMTIIQYDFPDDPGASGFCVFPEELETDDLVLFHSTPAENRCAILRDGFRIPDPQGVTGLPSVSFAKRSVTALTHAMDMRKSRPGAYCIIAVRYASLDCTGLKVNLIDIHDYGLHPPPEIIGYCTVPETYKHR